MSGPDRQEGDPPLGSWRLVYGLVLAWLVLQIVACALVTAAWS